MEELQERLRANLAQAKVAIEAAAAGEGLPSAVEDPFADLVARRKGA